MLSIIQQHWVMLTIIGSAMLFVLPWLWVVKKSRVKQRILQSGISRVARIKSHRPSMFKLGKHAGSAFMQGVDLWLEVHDDEPYEAKTRSVIHVSEFSKICPNMMVSVKVDPHNKYQVVLEKWHL